MKRGFIICLLVFGLCYATEDNIVSETKESSTATNINFRVFDKSKRGATKITNTDNPSFNHLSNANFVSSSSNNNNNRGFKPLVTASNPPQFRYFYNQQYYQPNPYFNYVHLPQAAQIASQYSFQSNPVAHYLQTPTQIQYVATPTVAQVPQINYQSYNNEYSSNAIASDSSSSAATGSQYVPQSQQSAVSSTQNYASSALPAGSSSTAAVTQTKQVHAPLYSGYQSVQPVYYTQQPLLTYFQQPQVANFIYQQPKDNYYLKQQQQLAGIYGGNRFGLYAPVQNAQLTYLVPMVVSQPEQSSTAAKSSLKSSDKAQPGTQQSTASNSFPFGAKP